MNANEYHINIVYVDNTGIYLSGVLFNGTASDCVRYVDGGFSPSTISLYDLEINQKVGSVNLSMDIRNAIHGLECWPFDE